MRSLATNAGAAAAEWVAVGRARDVPMLEGRSVQFGEVRVAIFRLPAGWAAIAHACPHAGGPLADGIVADSCVTCPLHGRRYSLLTGGRQDGDGEAVQLYAVRERDGLLELQAAGPSVVELAA